MYRNPVTLKYRPAHHSVSLGSAYTGIKYRPAHHSVSLGPADTGRDSDVVGYKLVSLDLGPVVESEKASSG
jgi:hypothetical protein